MAAARRGRPEAAGPASVATHPARRAPLAGGPARLRLTGRARRLLFLLTLCAAVGLGSWLGPVVSGEGDGDLRLAGVASVVVEPGDSLWSIAESVADGEDVRLVIDRIQALNGLEGSVVVPGQVLQLP